MKKLSRKIVCILSCAVLFCGASGMTADAETNRITLELNLTEVKTSLSEGTTLMPSSDLSEILQYTGNNYRTNPNSILKPNDGKIDNLLKANQKYVDLTLTKNEISAGKKATLEVRTQNTKYSPFGTVKYQWFGPNGLISGATQKTYTTIVPGSYYCYVWIDYDFDDDDPTVSNDNPTVLIEQGYLSFNISNLNLHRSPNDSSFKFPAGRMWKVPEGAVKTDTATVRLVNELTIEKQPMNMPIYDFEDGGVDYGAELSVSVTGGSGRYYYSWYNINSSELIGSDQIFTTYDIGEYYCVIKDDQGRTVKTNTAKSIGEPLCCHNKTKKLINIDKNGEYIDMDVDFEAGILNEEHIKTKFYIEWEEADIFKDNWTIIDSIITDNTVFTQKVYLKIDKQVRYNAYVMVNGKKCGQATSGITTVTNPLTVTLHATTQYPDDKNLYAGFYVTGGYGDIQFISDSSNKDNKINYNDGRNKDRYLKCKATPYGYIDYTTNELVVDWVCYFSIKDELGNTNITYGDEEYRGIVIKTDRSTYYPPNK